MAKSADQYFITEPWNIVEEGFDSEYSMVSESIFSLGNEFMGVRGYFEEGYSGKSLIGNYFNGIYESQNVEHSAYKGIIDKTEFIVNAVDWLFLRIQVGDEVVNLGESAYKEFKRNLNLKTGLLTRTYTWVMKDKKELKIEFERFVSMKEANLAGQKITFTPLNFSGEIIVRAGLDFSQIHNMVGRSLWECKEIKSDSNWCSILADTISTSQSLYSECAFVTEGREVEEVKEEKRVTKTFVINGSEGDTSSFTRIVRNISRKDTSIEDYNKFSVQRNASLSQLLTLNYEDIKRESMDWWEETWKDSDIVIEGDELNQQGIRFCIFQMHQTYHGAIKGAIIGAKGLTGEAYSGNTFWDTETYCLPFYIFNNVEAARQLLEYRYLTLEEAKKRAKALDCEGAFYPIATITGRECCSLWQHASLQLQASTAVAYGFWHYERITKDSDYVFNTGLPILVEVSRMLSTRGDWSQDGKQYGFYGVMGPDEFQMMVNNNCYTNYLGKITLEYTLDVLKRFKESNEKIYSNFIKEYDINLEEMNKWENIAHHMYISYDENTKLYEQHEGFFNLPHVDVDQIPIEDFPLYHHWTYDRIYRNDMIKQPDVLMMMLMYNGNFSEEVLRTNYEYYEPRCIHESSLSPSVHSILANQLGKYEEAYKFFGFATRMDLDNYNRNTSEGLHTTSIAAAWMNIVYGFAGMRSDREILSFYPTIPEQWKGYAFSIHYMGDVIKVDIQKDRVSLSTVNGSKIYIEIYGEFVEIGRETMEFKIPNK